MRYRNSYGIDTSESARTPRAQAMVAMKRSGQTFEQIGRYFGVSRQRVEQMVNDCRVSRGQERR